MKKVKLVLSIAAVTIAAGGALATSLVKDATTAVSVTSRSTPGNCPVKGTCSQATTTICKVASTQITLFSITTGSTCLVASTGSFTAAN